MIQWPGDKHWAIGIMDNLMGGGTEPELVWRGEAGAYQNKVSRQVGRMLENHG